MSDERELSELSYEELIEKHNRLVQNATRKADLLAIGTLSNLMQSADTERVKLDAASAWIDHRRKIEEAALKIQSDRENNGKRVQISFNVDALTKETENVRRIRDTFGVSIQPPEEDTQ